ALGLRLGHTRERVLPGLVKRSGADSVEWTPMGSELEAEPTSEHPHYFAFSSLRQAELFALSSTGQPSPVPRGPQAGIPVSLPSSPCAAIASVSLPRVFSMSGRSGIHMPKGSKRVWFFVSASLACLPALAVSQNPPPQRKPPAGPPAPQ